MEAVLRWRARKKAAGLRVTCGGRRTPKSKWYCERHRITDGARALAWKAAHREESPARLPDGPMHGERPRRQGGLVVHVDVHLGLAASAGRPDVREERVLVPVRGDERSSKGRSWRA